MRLLRAVLLAALWVCFTELSAATALADDPLAKQGVAPDQDSAALLQKVVHQIVAGHTVSPLEDNALANESSASEKRRNRIANALGETRARKAILGG